MEAHRRPARRTAGPIGVSSDLDFMWYKHLLRHIQHFWSESAHLGSFGTFLAVFGTFNFVRTHLDLMALLKLLGLSVLSSF